MVNLTLNPGPSCLQVYVLPLAELGGDFYDELKSRSSGYASFDYEDAGDRWARLLLAHTRCTRCACLVGPADDIAAPFRILI